MTQQTAVKQAGYFGDFGGQYVPDILRDELVQIEKAFREAQADPNFQAVLNQELRDYSGRATPLYHAKGLTKALGGAQIYLKREDLNHLGAHKINNVLGQILLAKRLGKKRVIAETGAGQHGVATAAVAAKFGLACDVYMGKKDAQRQQLNVFRMELMGAHVKAVTQGGQGLKDAVDVAMGDLLEHLEDTFYVIGSAVGPAPYPEMVRTFQSVISQEAKQQFLDQVGQLPDAVLACVGGGSNAIGAFHHFIPEKSVRLIACEAAGRGLDTGETAASLTLGEVAVDQGMKTLFLCDDKKAIAPTYSISAGLDYPGVGPEHAYLKTSGREEVYAITDDEALGAFQLLAKTEGILPALESSHALAGAVRLAPTMAASECLMVNLSGRGDKDVSQLMNLFAQEGVEEV